MSVPLTEGELAEVEKACRNLIFPDLYWIGHDKKGVEHAESGRDRALRLVAEVRRQAGIIENWEILAQGYLDRAMLAEAVRDALALEVCQNNGDDRGEHLSGVIERVKASLRDPASTPEA